MKNFFEHVYNYSRAYVSGLTSIASLILAYSTNLGTPEKIGLGVIAAIGSFAATAVVPTKANGITIAEAVTTDGDALAQATAMLKDVPLPGSAESVVSEIGQIASEAENLIPIVPMPSPPSPVIPTQPVSPDSPPAP